MHAGRNRRPSRNGTGAYRESGYSLLELVVVSGLVAVACAIAVTAVPAQARSLKADAEMRRVMAGLRQAHDLAVTQRRNVALQFPTSSTLQLVRQDVSGGVPAGTTVVDTTTLEGGFEYRLFPGLPDTPDGFGVAAAQSFGGAATVLFTSEGMLVDQTGDPVNGTISLGLDAQPLTARAVTVLGTTGLITGYRWDGRSWTK